MKHSLLFLSLLNLLFLGSCASDDAPPQATSPNISANVQHAKAIATIFLMIAAFPDDAKLLGTFYPSVAGTRCLSHVIRFVLLRDREQSRNL